MLDLGSGKLPERRPPARSASSRPAATKPAPIGRQISASQPAISTLPMGKVGELIKRRKAVRSWWEDSQLPRPKGVAALALSGGGIRSATFSLGVIQALAKDPRDPLSNVDI